MSEFGVQGKFENISIDEALGGQPGQTAQPQEQPKVEPVVETKVEEQPVVETKTTEEPKPEVKTEAPTIDEQSILSYLNEKRGSSFNSIDDLFKEPEVKEVEKIVEKEINPYEGISDSAKEFLEFTKTTGGSFEDYTAVKKDWSQVSTKELARAQARAQTGLDLSNEQADSYIQDQLGIEDFEEKTSVEKIKYEAYANKFKLEMQEKQKAIQSKVATKTEAPKQEPKSNAEMVTLDNGQQMPKEEYDALVVQHQQYITESKKSVDGITELNFDFSYQENGETVKVPLRYEITDEDRHSMLSVSKNLNAYIESKFTDSQGNFDYKGFHRALYFMDESNLKKVISAVADQSRNATIENHMKERSNVSLQQGNIERSSKTKDGYGELLGDSPQTGFGVLGNF
ncbi:MAG: hypothetical protein ACWA5P_01975 [bacterium]